MGFLDFLGLGNKSAKVNELLSDGAIIVDVRSKAEYAGGHIAKSKNIPLETVSDYLNKWKKTGQQVIFCCASGMRSGAATRQAKANGINAVNGGGWMSLNKMIEA